MSLYISQVFGRPSMATGLQYGIIAALAGVVILTGATLIGNDTFTPVVDRPDPTQQQIAASIHSPSWETREAATASGLCAFGVEEFTSYLFKCAPPQWTTRQEAVASGLCTHGIEQINEARYQCSFDPNDPEL